MCGMLGVVVGSVVLSGVVTSASAALGFVGGDVFAVVLYYLWEHSRMGIASIPPVATLARPIEAPGFDATSSACNVGPTMCITETGPVDVPVVATNGALNEGGAQIPFGPRIVVIVGGAQADVVEGLRHVASPLWPPAKV